MDRPSHEAAVAVASGGLINNQCTTNLAHGSAVSTLASLLTFAMGGYSPHFSFQLFRSSYLNFDPKSLHTFCESLGIMIREPLSTDCESLTTTTVAVSSKLGDNKAANTGDQKQYVDGYIGCSGLVVEYRTRNREVAGSIHTRPLQANLSC